MLSNITLPHQRFLQPALHVISFNYIINSLWKFTKGLSAASKSVPEVWVIEFYIYILCFDLSSLPIHFNFSV